MKKILLPIFILGILALGAPQANLLAQEGAPKLDYSGFVKCDGVVNPNEPDRKRECDLAALMDTIIKVVNFLFYISIPIAIALFAYAGLLYMTGREKHITAARGIFTSVAIGFIIMITAWFVVRQVVAWFVKEPAATFFVK
jgi:hypothetical protein